MFLTFVGVVMLRTLVDNPTTAGYVEFGRNHYRVRQCTHHLYGCRWMRSIHQLQSSPADVDGPLKLIWRVTALAVLSLSIWFIMRRYRIEQARYAANEPYHYP